MTTAVVSIRRSESIDQAFNLLLRHRISGLPVTDEEGRLQGVISEHDLLSLITEPDAPNTRVDEYWTDQPVWVQPDDLLEDIVDYFLTRHFRRLPVVDDDGRLVGVVSRRDLMRHIREVRSRAQIEQLTRAQLGAGLPDVAGVSPLANVSVDIPQSQD
jgi:CBS domain-containing protein